MDYKYQIIKKEDYKISNWSGGKTREMYIYPEKSNYEKRDFYFRISSATVELLESDFTRLEGVKRFITPIVGHLSLTHNFKEKITLKPFQVYKFDGGIETHSYGKVEDFNLMISKGGYGELKSISLYGEKNLDISNKALGKTFNIFYSPKEDISISISGKVELLEKGDIFIVELVKMCKLNIKLISENKINILQTKVYIENK